MALSVGFYPKAINHVSLKCIYIFQGSHYVWIMDQNHVYPLIQNSFGRW